MLAPYGLLACALLGLQLPMPAFAVARAVRTLGLGGRIGMALLAPLHARRQRGCWRWGLSGHRGTRAQAGCALPAELGQDLGGEIRLECGELVRVQPEGFPRPLAGRQGA